MKELIYHRGFIPAARNHAAKLCIVDGEYRATYAEHANRVFRLVHAMKHRLGLARGARFAVMSANSHQFLELYYAAFLGGGVITPLNTRLGTDELRYILGDSGAEVVFVEQQYLALMQEILHGLGADGPVRHVVQIDGEAGPQELSYEQLLSEAAAQIPDEPEEDDVVALMYTGGTTGLPKGVLNTQRSEVLNGYHAAMMIDVFGPDEVCLVQTPIFHAASMISILATPIFGGVLVLAPRFDASGMLGLVEAHGVTTTTMVPTMIRMMFDAPDFAPERIRSLRSISYGASPMPAVLQTRLFETSPELALYQAYGMTEAGSVLTVLSAEDHRRGGPRLRSVGRAVPGIELCIQGEDGTLCANGQVGEVCAKGGNFMTGYLNKKQATDEAFRGGWYHTGDAGYLDDDGYLFLVDRVKDMIISGGENIYSIEVENAIASHEAVSQVAVIGIPDDVWGEAVHAIVVPAQNARVTEQDILDHARRHIAGYKVPKSVAFRHEPLPLSGALKVLKRELRDAYRQDRS